MEKQNVSLCQKEDCFSMAYMLSFENGKPIAIAIDINGNIIHTIRVTRTKPLPDIEADNPLELIDRIDIEQTGRAMKFGRMEQMVLLDAVNQGNRERLSEPLQRGYDILVDKANEKLKSEITFNEGTVHAVIPLIGQHPEPFDRSILLIGPSGAGKSYLAKQILMHDVRKRDVYLFSKIRDDPSLIELTMQGEKSRLKQVPLFEEKDFTKLPVEADLVGAIVFFDDIDAFSGDRAEFLRNYRDSLLEAGRHKNITVISTSHILMNYNKSRVTLNESEWVLLFPPSNRRSADLFLKDRLGFDKSFRDHLIERSNLSGRYLGAKLSAPNAVLHQLGIILV